MDEKVYNVLCINPGNTSTKVALFENETKIDEIDLFHPAEELEQYPDIISQLPMRKKAIYTYLEGKGVQPSEIDAVAARGCPGGHRYHAGAYEIDQDMVDFCMDPRNAIHPMVLAPIIAYEWVKDFGARAYNYDVVMSDELTDIARIGSFPEIPRSPGCHVLNTKAVARVVAKKELNKSYEEVTFIMVHLGGGCSVSLHKNGHIVDTVSNGEGGFTPVKAGCIPYSTMMRLCFSGKNTEKDLKRKFGSRAGLVAHLGTSDCQEIEVRIENGDQHAALVYDAFIYNQAKDIGAMAAANKGKIDRIVVTGGIARSKKLTAELASYVECIAPVVIFPGALEMEALAAGILRVIRGEEAARRFSDEF